MSILQGILRFIGFCISLVYSENSKKYTKRIKDHLYSKIAMNWFKQTGPHVRICPPLFLNGGKYITIGNNFSILKGGRIEAIDRYGNEIFNPDIIIGDNVVINSDCHIAAINKIKIGNNVVMASRVYISDHSHGKLTTEDLQIPVAERPLFSKGNIYIEDNVWIREGVAILPNVRIGENSVIGANSVVTKDIPANSIAAGVPCRVLKTVSLK